MGEVSINPSRRGFQRGFLPMLVLLTVGGVAAIFWHFSNVSMKLIESKTLYDAGLYSDALKEFRTLYTSEVVEVVRSQGIGVTHDTTAHAGSIPLPATLSMELGRRIGELANGAETSLYSPFPFPWREGVGGLRDAFQKDAWKHFKADPTTPFYRFEDYKGRLSLRYATADLMRLSCLDCHNTHPASPKTDWKAGDVRGVLEVIFPMNRIAAETRMSLRGTLLLMLSMAGAGLGLLALMIGRIRRTGMELESSIAELRGAESRLRAANERLEAARDAAMDASRAKSQFLANMSHELRTPLNAIIGYSEMLREDAGVLGGAGAEGDLNKITAAGRSLLAMIDDVLDLTLYERNAVGLEITAFSIREVIRETAEVVRRKARENSTALEIHCPDDIGGMKSDAAKLQRCLLSVLDNAVKFTRGGRITLEVSREDSGGASWVVFRITDTGVGMTEEQTRSLFAMFSQADHSFTRKFGGAGMGLALTRKMCLLMGGDIEGGGTPGKGSCFTLRLPADVDSSAASEPPSNGGAKP